MKWVRRLGVLARGDLFSPWAWVALAILGLVAPCFVLLHATTVPSSWQPRPFFSEPATVRHFEWDTYSDLDNEHEQAVLLFRSLAPQPLLSTGPLAAFEVGATLLPLAVRPRGSSLWSFPLTGSALDFHRIIVPLLMTLIGALAFPSRRRLALLRVLMPAGPSALYLLCAGVLALAGLLVGGLTLASVALALAVTGAGAALPFVLLYSAALMLYALGFSLLGFSLAAAISNRAVALFAAPAVLVGLAPLLAAGQAAAFSALRTLFPQVESMVLLLSSGLTPWSVGLSVLFVPPPTAFYLLVSLLRADAGASHAGAAVLWSCLGGWAGIGCLVGWGLFVRAARRTG